MFELYGAVHKYVHIVHHSYKSYAAAMGVKILTSLPPPTPSHAPFPFHSRTNDKRKNHSAFSMFLYIINSWLDIQGDFEKKDILGRKQSCIKQNSEQTNAKTNKPGVYIMYYLCNLC